MTFFTIAIAGMYVSDGLEHGKSIWPAVHIIFLPSIVVVPIVTGSMAIFGLPVHWLLVRTHRASDLAYSLTGGLIGFALPMLMVLINGSADSSYLAMLGFVSGAATGHAWWRGKPTGIE
ncbi:hypothetical protein [Rhizobium sp. NFR03]|uniref:hypothetical protein n=1 Tax=Rhizobium sp. NFR03 TaxID=1566263 RepID=UPI001114C43C|nr:hypothetical protein [Rhizobium sp. NFR03]